MNAKRQKALQKIDWDAVEAKELEAHRAAGFVARDPSSGAEQINDGEVAEAVYQALATRHVVKSAAGMAKGAVTAHELYAEIFPAGPGATTQPATDEEEHARDNLKSKCWKFATTSATGRVNKRIELEGKTLVLCEAKVARTYDARETAKTTPTKETARFLSDDASLIQLYSLNPVMTRGQKAVGRMARHVGMLTTRHPEVSGAATRQVTNFVKLSSATLTAAIVTKTESEPADAEA